MEEYDTRDETKRKGSNMKFKKKALVIDAIKWTGENVMEIDTFTGDKEDVLHKNGILHIPTSWGVMECKIGDMVMKGVAGEIYSCDADVFSKSYEHVEGQKYRKVSVIIEAVQLTWRTWNDICDFVPNDVFVESCYLDADNKEVKDCTDKLGLKLKTLEGIMTAKETDWVIRGVNGEFYYNDDAMFNKIFEKIEE
jgi:hypothetical protein